MIRYIFSPLLLLLLALPAAAQPAKLDLKGKTLVETFAELLPGMGAADNGARSNAQQRWQDICFALSAPDNERLRTEACELMAAKLDDKTPKAARLWLLQQLQRIGHEECLAALKSTLDDKDAEVREMAIRALANNPSPKATTTLLGAYPNASEKDKIGILNAWGHQGNKTPINFIAKQLSSETDIAVAAAKALGRMPVPLATDPLIEALASKNDAIRNAAANALLAHADSYLKNAQAKGAANQFDDGDLKRAANIYNLLGNARETRPIRMASLRGVILTSGDKAGDIVLATLTGGDAKAKAVAIAQIEHLTPKALKVVCDNLDEVSPATRMAVVTALAERRERAQLPVVLSAAKSKDADVKRAGLHALGRLGDASTVEFLLEAMSAKDGTGNIAAESLAALAVDGVNEKLVAVYEAEKAPARKVALIGILDRRRASSAVPTLLKAAADADGGVRTTAFNALKTLAAPTDVPGMVAALLKTSKGGERDQAELAIVAVSSQVSPENRAKSALELFREGSGVQADLLPLLGRLGGSESLKEVRRALTSSDKGLREAAVIALCNWPDVNANADLLTLAEKPLSPPDQQRAIRALIRVNAVVAERTPEEKLAALETIKKTMKLAATDADRRAVIENVGFIRHIETLRFLLPYLDQPTFEQAACRGIVELAHSKMVREPNKAEFDKVLNRVISVCKDKGLVDRAKQYKEGR